MRGPRKRELVRKQASANDLRQFDLAAGYGGKKKD